jgi:hypothetical protein
MKYTIDHVINTSLNEVSTISQKENLNHIDKLRIMIYSNIYRVFSKVREIKDAKNKR